MLCQGTENRGSQGLELAFLRIIITYPQSRRRSKTSEQILPGQALEQMFSGVGDVGANAFRCWRWTVVI